jgi:protein TonB
MAENGQEALDAVRTWRFVPGTRDGVPDSMWTRVPVVFRLK